MRKPILIASLMLFAALVGSQLTARYLEHRHAAQLEERQQQWELDQREVHDRLEAALGAAKHPPSTFPVVQEGRAQPSLEPRPEHLLATLAATPSLAGLEETARSRRIIYLLEKLVETGTAAVVGFQLQTVLDEPRVFLRAFRR